MKKSEDKFKTIFNNLIDIYYETDMDGNITTISPSVQKITGYDQNSCIDKNITFLFRGNKYRGLIQKVIFNEKSVSNFEIQLIDINGNIHQTLVSAKKIKTKDGKSTNISGLIKDISDRKKEQEKLFYFATYDEMTGVYNRRVGIEFLNQELKKINRVNTYLSICFIDINDLKIVNDNFGHEAGDRLINFIVQDIKSAMRESDILSRLGGDEFLLILPDCRLEEVRSVWQRVEDSLAKRNEDPSIEYNVSASYGFAETNPEKNLSAEKIMQIADMRMYAHKRRSKQQKVLGNSK